MKFLRLGGIQIEVSTQGFILNLTKFKAQMDEFRCQGEVLQWPTLIANMERHLAVSLFTNAASSSLSRFTHLFRFSGQPVIVEQQHHAKDNKDKDSADPVAEAPPPRKSSFAIWEGTENIHTATSLKRSALGLPPSKTKGGAQQPLAMTGSRSDSDAPGQEMSKDAAQFMNTSFPSSNASSKKK